LIWKNYTLTTKCFTAFSFLPPKRKNFSMHTNQVLKICNVAYPLLKSVIFYGNNPRATYMGFFRAVLLQISLKTNDLKNKNKNWSIAEATPMWPNRGGSPPLV
jgi:hypothetical protein